MKIDEPSVRVRIDFADGCYSVRPLRTDEPDHIEISSGEYGAFLAFTQLESYWQQRLCQLDNQDAVQS